MQSAWCVVAAFGTYACMYGFRKPFTAGTYPDAGNTVDFKVWLVAAQVMGYTVSKFAGIRVIAEMRPEHRTRVLLGLIGIAELALLLFAWIPAPWNTVCLFLNGLPLGMVFGLVLGFLEGRKLTEAFVAGLCASFILADGFTKSVGAKLLALGVPGPWMPFTAGLVFLLPLLGFTWMLQQIPPPTLQDKEARSERTPMLRSERLAFLKRHGLGLGLVILAYLLVTVVRSLRADFAPEIWTALGTKGQPAVFTRSELWVTLGVIAVNGMAVVIRDNRRALLSSFGVSMAGLVLVLAAIAGLRGGLLTGFPFMVLLGLGMYIPYVAVHTTVFERLIALTRDRGNIGYLMYLADAIGYLGYVGVMLVRRLGKADTSFLPYFITLTGAAAIVGIAALAGALLCFRKLRNPNQAA
jgi:MFS family permease